MLFRSENTQRQAEFNKQKDAQVNDLNEGLLQHTKEQKELARKAKEAEKALRNLQLKRTKEQKQSISTEDIQRMIKEGIEKNPIRKTMIPEKPKTPPNTGATSMKTAPENQKQYIYCDHGNTGFCYSCKYAPCPGCKKRMCENRPQCKGKNKAPLNEEETLRMGVRFQQQIPLSQKEKELLDRKSVV